MEQANTILENMENKNETIDQEEAVCFINFLKEELDRKKRNREIRSLRGFAKELGVSPASLCQILSGKRPLTCEMKWRLATGLNVEYVLLRKFKQFREQ